MPALDPHEADEQRDGHRQAREGPPRPPAPVVGLDQREDESHRAQRDGRRALDVVAAADALGPALGEEPRRQQEDRRADRHVDEEDPAPAEQLDDHATEQEAGRAAGAGDRAPDAERPVALAALRERREDDRQRRGRDHRAAEALRAAGDQQRRLRLRQPAGDRRAREQRHAGHEQATTTEPVGRAPAEQQEPSEEQRVGVEHPRQVLLGEADVALDARQRDVHDARVEHHHELGHRDDGEHRVGARRLRTWPARDFARGTLMSVMALHDRPDPGEPSSPDDGDSAIDAGARRSAGARAARGRAPRSARRRRTTRTRSSSKPVSTVSPPFSSGTIEGKADRAVAPSRPLIADRVQAQRRGHALILRPDVVSRRRWNPVIARPAIAAVFASARSRGAAAPVRAERRRSDCARRAWSRCCGRAC